MNTPTPSEQGVCRPLLRLEKVTLGHTGEKGALIRSVDWQVNRGEFWAVAGVNGSGKTSLLSVAAGMERPPEGVVRLLGEDDLWALPEAARLERRLRVGSCLRDNGRIFPGLTVLENVSLPVRYHRAGKGEEQLGAALEATGLARYAHNTPANIPVALQRRIALARALALGPELLLLDDPFVALDLRERRWWLAFIGNLARGGHAGCHPAIVALGSELDSWRDVAQQFALIRENRLLLFPHRAELENQRELLGEFETREIS